MSNPSSIAVGCLVIFGSFLLRYTVSDIYSSIVHFEQVLHMENALASDIQAFIEQEEDRLEQLKRIAAEYRSHSHQSLQDAENYLSNPINAYLLMKKFTHDWYKVISMITNEKAEEFVRNVSQTYPSFPGPEDLVGAAKALLRLQDTYALDTARLAKGDVNGLSQTRPLTGAECSLMGHVAYESGNYYHTILWYTEAVSRLRAEGANNATLVDAMGYLEFALYKQGNVQAALYTTGELLEMDPANAQALHNRAGYLRELGSTEPDGQPATIKNERSQLDFRASEEYVKYERLCRGEQIQVRNDLNKEKQYRQENRFRDTVRCQYKREHPYYLLRPLKEEVVLEDPFVAVYHDLMTDSEIAAIKGLATPRLHRSQMVNKGGDPDEIRVSKSAWLSDEEDRLIERVSDKVAAATGLSLEPAENLQVLNYGLGGQYEPHTDWVKDMANAQDQYHFNTFGNRISTSLFYMSDVPGGGATVFPELGLQVFPEKGMMLLWYNLHYNGTGDPRTVHAGCPVLVGSKWVCNKWIHEGHQEFRRKCGLNEFH